MPLENDLIVLVLQKASYVMNLEGILNEEKAKPVYGSVTRHGD